MFVGVLGFMFVVVVLMAVLLVASSALFTVQQQTVAIVQRLGKFHRQATPGLHVKVPLAENIVGRLTLRVVQLDVKIETKTDDNVFVQLVVAVQYFVLPDRVYDAFYKLEDAKRQITSFVFDVVRAQVPKIKLDDVFAKKDEIADTVERELAQVMQGFGYGILKALVTDIEPDARVKEAMNEITWQPLEPHGPNAHGQGPRRALGSGRPIARFVAPMGRRLRGTQRRRSSSGGSRTPPERPTPPLRSWPRRRTEGGSSSGTPLWIAAGYRRAPTDRRPLPANKALRDHRFAMPSRLTELHVKPPGRTLLRA